MKYTGLTLEEAARLMDGARGGYAIARKENDGTYTLEVEGDECGGRKEP